MSTLTKPEQTESVPLGIGYYTVPEAARLIDNNLAPAIAHALNALFKGEHQVIALKDRFRRDITDVELIEALSREGRWVFISGDRRITRNRAEYQASRSSKLDIERVAGTVEGGAMFELQMKSARSDS